MQGWIDATFPNDGITLIPDAGDGTRVIIDAKEGKKTSHPMEIEVILGASSSIIGGGIGNGVLPGDVGTTYMGMLFGQIDSSTEADMENIMPLEGVVSDFYVWASGDIGDTGDALQFTVRRNELDTDVGEDGSGGSDASACIIDGDDTTPFTCFDTTDSQCFEVTDRISIEIVGTGAATLNDAVSVNWTAVFTPGSCTP